MSRGKEFTTTEINEIRSFLKDGLTYAEVGELMGRSKKSIENLAHRQGWTRGRFKDEPKTNQEPPWSEVLKDQETKQEEPVLEMEVEEVVEEKPSPVVEVKSVKEKTLFDFTPRQILHHLFGVLGYYIKGSDWQLACKVEQIVNLNDIVKNG